MVAKSKSGLVTIVIHVLIWVAFALILFFFQPLTWNIVVPYQFWIKNGIVVGLLVIAYYFNSSVLVPQLLLKNRTSIYFLIIISVAVVIVMVNKYADQWLNIPQLMGAAFHKSGPPKHHNRNNEFDIFMIVTTALVMGISTSITTIQKWQHDKQVHQDLEQDRDKYRDHLSQDPVAWVRYGIVEAWLTSHRCSCRAAPTLRPSISSRWRMPSLGEPFAGTDNRPTRPTRTLSWGWPRRFTASAQIKPLDLCALRY